jgi:molybdate transport system regulatory protein
MSASVRIRVDFPERRSIGIGKVELLERIAVCGSLAQAARQMRMSYRRAWLLLEDINLTFDEPVARTSVGGRGGGGVRLTKFGEALVLAYRQLEGDIEPLVSKYFDAAAERLAKRKETAPKRNTIKLKRPSPGKS